MDVPIKAIKQMNENKTWSITEEKDGITKRLSVEKVENGFVITKNKYGYEGEGEKRNYIDVNKKYISTKNPLEGQKEEIKSPMSREQLFSFLDGEIED
jgi:hypothetical protein